MTVPLEMIKSKHPSNMMEITSYVIKPALLGKTHDSDWLILTIVADSQ